MAVKLPVKDASVRAATAQATSGTEHAGMRKPIEAGWLLAAALIPMAVAHEDFMLGFIQMPKVFVLRTAALYLVVMVVLEWALSRPRTTMDNSTLPGRLRQALVSHPARVVYLGASAVLLANLVSIAFAPVKSIAVWGIDPGWDTYALFNVVSYLVLFAIVATHLRTGAQLRRLVLVLTATSMVISLYAVGQHFGVDPFKNDPTPELRASSTFGNPIFAGSYLLMTMPLTLALFMSYRDRMPGLAHIGIGAALIALQVTAVIVSLSRGPWIGVGVGAIAFVALFAWVVGPRHAVRTVAIGVLAGAIAVLLIALPVPGSGRPANASVAERVGSIAPDVGGGLNHRFTIWRTAADVYFGVPWVDTELYPEIPDLGFEGLRRIVGYGPDMFVYAYPLAGESTYTFELASHGHNFIVHTGLELGFFGVASYVALIGALGLVLLRLLRSSRAGQFPDWIAFLVVGLAAALAGRIVEQIPGKAQVSDLALSWMLAGVVVAVSVMRFDESRPATGPPQRPRRRRASDAQYSPLRVAAAAAVTVVVIVFWFPAVWANVHSAWVAARANDAAEAGQTQRHVDLYMEARNIAPDLAVNRLRLADALSGAVPRVPREDRTRLLETAYGEMQTVLERNPLDHRARSRAGEYLRELAIARGEQADVGVRDNQILVQLMPGFWQAHAALAWAYVRLGEYEQGLQTVVLAQALSATAKANTHQLYYVEAVALQALGRIDDALLAAERSMKLRPNQAAEQLLEELTSTAAIQDSS